MQSPKDPEINLLGSLECKKIEWNIVTQGVNGQESGACEYRGEFISCACEFTGWQHCSLLGELNTA